MKSLMDVIKNLMQINGVLALLTFSIVVVVRQQQPKTITETSEFHREIQAIPSEEQATIAENAQKIANLEAKSQQKDQQIQELKREFLTYQQSRRQSEKSSEIKISPNLAKNPNKNSSSISDNQLNSQPRPTTLVAQTASPLELSQRDPTEYGDSKKRFSESLALLPPKTEVTSNSNRTSASEKFQKKPIPQESIPNKVNSTIPKPPSEGDLAKLEPQKPVSDPLKQDYQSKNTTSVSETSQKKPTSEESIPNIAMSSTSNPFSQGNGVKLEPKNPKDKAIHMANDLVAGLLVAHQKNHIKYNTQTYRKVQTAIVSLRQGHSTTIEQAARMSGLKPSVLAQVAKWGQDRPGSFESDSQISLSEGM